MRSTKLRIALAVACATAAAAAATAAGETAATPPPEVRCPAIDTPPPAAASVRVAIDPATGRLRPPTAEEARALVRARTKRSERTYQVEVRPDGTRVVALDDAFFMSVIAEKQPDGTVRTRCVSGPLAAAEKK